MLNGIDVSSYQAKLNVSTYPCDFVICKATEGTGYVNPFCDIHYQQAKSSGKLLGVYHFARPDTGNSPEAEADYFLRNITGYIGEAILALDLECTGWQKYSEWSKKWLDRVYEKTGIRPLFYSSGDGFANFKDMLNAGNYGVWVASDGNWYDGTTIVIKQSVYDDLDHDVFYGDATAWHKYANPSGTSTAPVIHTITMKEQPKTNSVYYTVKSGDTLSDIASKYGTTYQHLAQINGISNPNLIYAGQKIKIDGTAPVDQSEYYEVQSGDTLSGIAERYGTSYQHLARINGIENPNLIYVGQKIKVKYA